MTAPSHLAKADTAADARFPFRHSPDPSGAFLTTHPKPPEGGAS
ncbi:MAG: hypothetical protein AAGD47_01700 [Pseudomonadota bacterium]